MKKSLFSFVLGAVVGAVGTWVYMNKRYFGPVEEPIEEDDLPAVTRDRKPKSEEGCTQSEAEVTDYQKMAKQYSKEDEPKQPYVITREEYCDSPMPLKVTYSYFEDGIVTDEYNEIVDDAEVKEAIGEDFVNYFDEDLVYIRNEQRKCDYEILREGITYIEPPEEE